MKTNKINLLDLQPSVFTCGADKHTYWSQKEGKLVKLGLIDRIIYYLFGDRLGLLETRIQLCAQRSLAAIASAVRNESPTRNLLEKQLVINYQKMDFLISGNAWYLMPQMTTQGSWRHFTREMNAVLDNYRRSTSKTTQCFSSIKRKEEQHNEPPDPSLSDDSSVTDQDHLESSADTEQTSTAAPADETDLHAEWAESFQTDAPPMDEETMRHFTALLVEIFDKKPEIITGNHSVRTRAITFNLLRKYANKLNKMITLTSKYPPKGELITHPLRLMSVCLKQGPIYERIQKMKLTSPDRWNLCADLFVRNILFNLSVFNDENMVNGFLMDLGIEPNSENFNTHKNDIKTIKVMLEKYKTISSKEKHCIDIDEAKCIYNVTLQLCLELFNNLVDRPLSS